MTNSKFQLQRVRGAPVSDNEIIADIRRVAQEAGTQIITQQLYSDLGKYNPTTASRRFGTWNKAVAAAGCDVANEVGYDDERLFQNLLLLWEHYGRQPRRAELAKPPSQISQTPYNRRFLTWTNALEQFVAYANSQDIRPLSTSEATIGHRTSRDPSLRLRFRVMKRDSFTCRACGASPALRPGLVLHVDHIIPWSHGGETTEENLRTLCEQCNLGKSNIL